MNNKQMSDITNKKSAKQTEDEYQDGMRCFLMKKII